MNNTSSNQSFDQSFNQWLPQCEADLRNHTQYLFHKHQGWRLGIDSGDLFHDVVVKLAERDYPINNRNELFALVGKVALNRLWDLGRKRGLHGEFFSIPMPTRSRPLPGSSMETVAAKEPSPDKQAALRDEVESIGKAAAEDPELALLFETVSDLVGRGEPTSIANIGRTLNLHYKQAAKSIGKLRSLARGMR